MRCNQFVVVFFLLRRHISRFKIMPKIGNLK